MKRVFNVVGVLAVMVLLFGLQGCDEEKVKDVVGLGTLKVTLDGAVYDFTLVKAVETENIIAVGGAESVTDTAVFTLMLDADIVPGTYHLEAAPDGKYVLKSKDEIEKDFYALWYKGEENVYFSESGTLTIEEHDKEAKKINGTFSLKMLNAEKKEIEAKDGIFNVEYEKFDLPEE
jgi:hypothetical protein